MDSLPDAHHEIPSPSIPKRIHKKRKSSQARLRKLYRRATTTSCGITSRSEWEELTELYSDWKTRNSTIDHEQTNEKYADALPGPVVSIRGELSRDFRHTDKWQSSKVADHRNILANLLFGGEVSSVDGAHSSNRKRRKQETADQDEEGGNVNSSLQHTVNIPSLPSWASISNLASMGGVAVIEIDINDPQYIDDQTKCSLMPSEFLQKTNCIWETLHSNDKDPNMKGSNKRQVKRIIGAACKVKMFQGDFPRCISDEIMFLPPPSLSKLSGNEGNKSDLFQSIFDLRLTQRQLELEGYPKRYDSHGKIDENSELNSKIPKTKKIVDMRASTFWERFTPNINDEVAALIRDENALELVEILSVRETVCCGEEAIFNEDELSRSEFWVETFLNNKERPPKVFALDCEMVQTAAGQELARVSLILLLPDEDRVNVIDATTEEEETTLILDELVKPRRQILNYLTEYSGITPKMLQNVTNNIEHVQTMLLSLIQSTDVIVGHSVENDLKALKVIHRNIVDTSCLFRGVNGRKNGLRYLTNVMLKRQIQNGDSGHCSIEDAKAALILVTRRARLGPAFQLKENSRGKSMLRTFQSINRETNKCAVNFAECSKGPCVCIGSNKWINRYAKSDGSQHALTCESLLNSMSMAIPSWLSSSTSGRRASFLWANLSCGEERGASRDNELKKLEELIENMIRRVPFETPILMMFQRNYKEALALAKRRKIALKSTTMTWTDDEEEMWQKCINTCMNGEAIWITGAYIC